MTSAPMALVVLSRDLLRLPEDHHGPISTRYAGSNRGESCHGTMSSGESSEVSIHCATRGPRPCRAFARGGQLKLQRRGVRVEHHVHQQACSPSRADSAMLWERSPQSGRFKSSHARPGGIVAAVHSGSGATARVRRCASTGARRGDHEPMDSAWRSSSVQSNQLVGLSWQ